MNYDKTLKIKLQQNSPKIVKWSKNLNFDQTQNIYFDITQNSNCEKTKSKKTKKLKKKKTLKPELQ